MNYFCASGYSLDELRDAFEACDQDGSGEIDAFELAECMTSMGEVTYGIFGDQFSKE
jgi:Ca2+-binding EF-hand superfamily protein